MSLQSSLLVGVAATEGGAWLSEPVGCTLKTTLERLLVQGRTTWSKCQSAKPKAGEQMPTKLADDLLVMNILAR